MADGTTAQRIGFDLDGRRALVTGASSGLGAHFAALLAAHGAEVWLGARRFGRIEEGRDAIRRDGGRAEAIALDVTDPASVESAFADRAFDIVVNNAGLTATAPAIETSEADWSRVIDTDLTGLWRVSTAAARALTAQDRGGSIVNIASILGLRVAGVVSAYAAAKAGVVQLTRAHALEWARHGIRVNALCPGYVETDLNREFFETDQGQALLRRVPMRRLGQPANLDAPLLMLVSDHGRFVTGTEIVVDGGHMVSSL